MEQVPLLISFSAGILSFLSPCVLPLIPGYISFVTGLSVAEMTAPD
ncbi:MAG: cytochrome c biogenesis protein CcdA, partial [Deltaproteobacteria bacterium]